MKNQKIKKVFSYIGLGLLIACGIAYVVLYCLYPAQTLDITFQVRDYVCEKPLPVVGCSLLVVLIVVYKIIKFGIEHKSKKMKDLLCDLARLHKELDESKAREEELKQLIYEQSDKCLNKIKEVCAEIPNRKVKEIGERIHGKENDSIAETESE